MSKDSIGLAVLVAVLVGLVFYTCSKKSPVEEDSASDGSAPSPPGLSWPEDGATDVGVDPTLSWIASDEATSYTLQVCQSDSFSSFVLNKPGIDSTNHIVSGLAVSTQYYWRVNASNNYGTSGWSNVWSFTTCGSPLPSPPTLLSPSDDATDVTNTPTLVWNPSTSANHYTLQVSSDSSFSGIVVYKAGIMSTSHTVGILDHSSTYYWRVNAVNNYGTSAWSSVWSFTIEPMTGTWTTYNTSNSGLPYNEVRAMAIDALGNIWFGTRGGGVAKFDGTQWTTYDTQNSGLASNYVWAIAIDSSGNKWFGGSGTNMFDGTNWTTYNSQNSGLPGYGVSEIAVDASGNKWIGTYGGGVAKFDGSNWITYNASNSGLANNSIWAIAIDEGGNKWFGTAGGGVNMFDGTDWTTYDASNSGLAGNMVGTIAFDPSGSKWFGTSDSGVSKFDGTSWTTYNTENSGLASNKVWTIAVDALGTKWFGTSYGGVSRFDGANWTTYNTSNCELAYNSVAVMAIDRSGNKWFGTFGGGVSKFHE